MSDISIKNVTIYDVARAAKVSPATVSRVLTGNANVSEEKRRLIIEQIEKQNFKPNALARGLSVSKTFTIGFIVPDIKNEYFSTVYYEFEKYISGKGYTALVANSQGSYERESELLNIFKERRVDGIILMGGRADSNSCDKKYFEEIEEINKTIPIILTSRNTDIKVPQVYLNEKQPVFDMIAHLKAQECKSVGLLCGYNNINVSVLRRSYFEEACEAEGIEIMPEWIIDGDFTIEGGSLAMSKLCECLKIPDAVCCINDMSAVGALNYSHSHNINVPNDILITGFDGGAISESVYPQITTVQVDYPTFAQMIVKTLLGYIDETEFIEEASSEPRVIVRGSTRRMLK